MAPSPVVAEVDTDRVRLSARLRVMHPHPHVAELLRSPRRLARPATKPAPGPEEAERPRYGCAFEDDEGGVAPGRLVWAKVRGHPWWPAQVFNAADASPLARARRRTRRAVLVAYFGDKTFTWNEAHTLRPFRAGFAAGWSEMAPVAAAVEAALDEVARRVEAGLSCCCGGKENSETTASREVIDNAGIREGAVRGEALLSYISSLAVAPQAGADRVDLAVAAAQLRAFGRWRSSARGLPEYTVVLGSDGAALKAKAAPGRASKRRRSSSTGGATSDGGDYEALKLEDFPQATPQHSTRSGSS